MQFAGRGILGKLDPGECFHVIDGKLVADIAGSVNPDCGGAVAFQPRVDGVALSGRDVERVQKNVELEVLQLRIGYVGQEMRFPWRTDEAELPLFLRGEQRVEERLAIAAVHETG